MKKFGICLILAFFVFGTSCFAQSNNDAQRIVGTWIHGSGLSYTFNSNGTWSYISSTGSSNNGNYFFSGSKIILKLITSNDADVYDFYFSPNGRILVIGSAWFEKQ